MNQTPQVATSETNTLYRHERKPEWGLAVVAWEHEGKRGYQFSDGELRVIKEGYYRLLTPTAAPGDGSARAVLRMARREAAGDTDLPSVRHQARYFKARFPGGFNDPQWVARHRGEGRRLKRHRDPAVEMAAQEWDRTRLESFLERGECNAVMDAATKVLRTTDLVALRNVKRLEKVPATEGLARAFIELIHGEDPVTGIDNFRKELKMVKTLSRSWPLCTAPRALVHPEEDMAVRPSVLAAQARVLLPGFKAPGKPRGRDYLRYRELTRGLGKELATFDLTPRDMFDLYDFIWLTMRPAARKDVLNILAGEDRALASGATPTADAEPDSTDPESESDFEAA